MTWYKITYRKKIDLIQGDAELARVLARKVPKVIMHREASVYRCETCGHSGPWMLGISNHRDEMFITDWRKRWHWYGRYSDPDNEISVRVFCCKTCAPDLPEERVGSYQGDNWKSNLGFHQHEPLAERVENWRMERDAREAADPRKFPHPENDPDWPADRRGNGWCRWCNGEVKKESGRRTWHPKCLTLFWLHTSLDAQYRHLADRDGEKCQLCPPGYGRWVKQAEMRRGWRDDSELIGHYIKWSQVLQVDHVIPLWSVIDLPPAERRIYFGPENLWLLCERHHREKSKVEARDRAAARREKGVD